MTEATETCAAAIERMARDCGSAAMALRATGEFPAGESILTDAAATLRAIAAERDRLQGEAWYWRNMFAFKNKIGVAEHYDLRLSEIAEIKNGSMPVPAGPPKP